MGKILGLKREIYKVILNSILKCRYPFIGVVCITLLVTLLFISTPEVSNAEIDPTYDEFSREKGGPVRLDIPAINRMNRVHRRSNIWMNVTNWGFFGNYGENDTRRRMLDPCTSEWAPQAEYPGGSGVQYLFQGALWLGALIRAEGYEYPRVSVGMDGWHSVHEFWSGEGETNSLEGGIVERTTLPMQFDCIGNFIGAFRDSAVSEQDFVATYADTLTHSYFVSSDEMDGPHIPLGIKIVQKSYAWTYSYAQNFIIIDWEIENIAGNYLKNLYVGLYFDGDVGHKDEQRRHEDDITGFQRYYYYTRPDGELDSTVINTAWIADNDGRPATVSSGSDFTAPGVIGVRVLRAPNPKLATSYNWWVSHGDAERDFGPSWKEDGAPGGWTDQYGTPMGDLRKYFILSNSEFDYDQVMMRDPDYVRANPQLFRDRWTGDVLESKDWKIPGVDDSTPQDLIDDLAKGYDTRFLLSWGPLGIFDHIDEAGNRIYRLNPGEKFSMTIAIVVGDNFHDVTRPQPTNETIDPSLFNFASLRYNADWAMKVYDNPMYNTPIYDYGSDGIPGTFPPDGTEGDGILDTGDGWYGEDVGIDGLYAENVGDIAYRWVGGVRIEEIYPGPDEGEMDGKLQPEEDALERPEPVDWQRMNGILDLGDGYPDFRGPPPPPLPDLEIISDPVVIQVTADSQYVINEEFLSRNVVLRWHKLPSEDPDYVDPFSREHDFEGYRIYVSNRLLERDFAFLDEFDKKNWSLYSVSDSLAWMPIEDMNELPPDTVIRGEYLRRKAVGKNIGFSGHHNLIPDTSGYYYYIIFDTHPMIPRYYSVTAFDWGDYKSGLQSLESSRIANAVYTAPSGNPREKVQVVPNPYRANEDYTIKRSGMSWENREGRAEYFPQIDRRIYFYNLPRKCLIRIYTLAGDLVYIIEHNASDRSSSDWASEFAASWDLNSRNKQQVVAGMYLFTVAHPVAEALASFSFRSFKFIPTENLSVNR